MKDKEFYTPIEAARAVLDAVKKLAALNKGEHDPKNLDKLKGAVDKFIGEEGMEKGFGSAVSIGGMGGAKAPAKAGMAAPQIPKAPAMPKPASTPHGDPMKMSEPKAQKSLAKFMSSRGAKMAKAKMPNDPGNGGPEPKQEANPAEMKKTVFPADKGNGGPEPEKKGDLVKGGVAQIDAQMPPPKTETARPTNRIAEPVKKSMGKEKIHAQMPPPKTEKAHPTNRMTAPIKKAEYKDPTTSKTVPRDGGPEPKKEGDLVKAGAFKKLESKLEGKGMSEKEAGGIAYNQGKAKYGKAGMAAKAKAGKK